MILCVVFFLLSLLPVTIFYKYFIFSYSAIFNLAFLFPFKLREELLHFKKLQSSISEVKVKHYLILVCSFKIFSTNIIVMEKSWQGKSDQSDNFNCQSKFLNILTIHMTVLFDSLFSEKLLQGLCFDFLSFHFIQLYAPVYFSFTLRRHYCNLCLEIPSVHPLCT